VEEAFAAIKVLDAFDCMILDVRLGQEIASDIAGSLVRREVRFVVCSGYDIRLPGMNIPVLSKPYTLRELGKGADGSPSTVRINTVAATHIGALNRQSPARSDPRPDFFAFFP
jgi:hypothetical protein